MFGPKYRREMKKEESHRGEPIDAGISSLYRAAKYNFSSEGDGGSEISTASSALDILLWRHH